MIGFATAELEALDLGRLDIRGPVLRGVQVDSRRIAPGDLFVAVGRGAAYLDEAIGRGAAATLVPADAFAALASIAAAVRALSHARVIGITGSTGKTSTKDILAAICSRQARTVAAEASYNNEIGVPLTLCRLEADTDICIVEMGMRGFGQIARLCEIVRPELGIVTNTGPVHLELVETVAGVVRAKSELVRALPRGGIAIVPFDFPVDRTDLTVIRPEGDVRVEDGRTIVRYADNDVEFDFVAHHQGENALIALAAAKALGLELPHAVEVEFSRWRGEEQPLPGGGLLINDSYNANPVSMHAALRNLAERAAGRRRVAVLGEMAELGSDAARYHVKAGVAARAAGVDLLVAIGPLARGYVEGAAGVRARHLVGSVDEGIELLRELIRPGDCVLVKASRRAGLERVAEALLAGAAAR